MIAGDYNGDGKTDLILLSEGDQTTADGYNTAGIMLLAGNGDGTFLPPAQLGTGNFFLNGQLADVNGDGIPDIVVALYGTNGQPNGFYGLSTFLGEGGGAFSNPINALEPMHGQIPMIGNFYNDNAPDVMVAGAYGPVLFLGKGGTTLSLSASAASSVFGSGETFTVTMAPTLSTAKPTGTISFYDGQALLGSVALSGGQATYNSSSLAVGAHTITAAYSGDANFNVNTASATTVTVIGYVTSPGLHAERHPDVCHGQPRPECDCSTDFDGKSNLQWYCQPGVQRYTGKHSLRDQPLYGDAGFRWLANGNPGADHNDRGGQLEATNEWL